MNTKMLDIDFYYSKIAIKLFIFYYLAHESLTLGTVLPNRMLSIPCDQVNTVWKYRYGSGYGYSCGHSIRYAVLSTCT